MTNAETGNLYGLREQEENTKGQKSKAKSRREFIHLRTVFNRVEPLFIRGASAGEIMLMTGLNRKQVNNAINRKTKSTPQMHRVDEEFFAPHRVKARISRSHKGKPKRLIDRPPMSQEEINRIEFAKIAQEKGFFTDDLTHWNKLNGLYERFGRKLPESFYDRFRLEVFLSAIEQTKRGDTALLNKYVGMGSSIGLEWFKLLAQEEGFIKAKLLTYWADGEDEKGFFKLNENGEKTRQVEREDEGYVNVNSQMTLGKLVKKAIQARSKISAKGRSRR